MLRYVFLVGACIFVFSSCGAVKFSAQSASTTDTPPGGTGPTGTGTTPTPIPTAGPQYQDVSYSATVTPANNKLDILLVIDDSNSMLADSQKLAAKLSTFVDGLQNSSIDWQMCVTVTRALTVNSAPSWGASIVWSNYTPTDPTKGWVLKPTANLSTIFTNTINNIGAGWANTDDERAIKSSWWHLYNGDPKAAGNSGCYRADAAMSVITISDEDERSVGGDKSLEYIPGEYKALENDDLPETLVKQVTDIFGSTKRFTFNSIIVKPDDKTCMADQDKQGSKSHFGITYAKLSQLTGGGIGSICDADFSTSLNLFKGVIQDSIASFPLQCAPVGDVTVSVAPSFTYTYTIQGKSIVFTPSLPAGRKLTLNYKCLK